LTQILAEHNRNPKHKTLNPEPETRNPKPYTFAALLQLSVPFAVFVVGFDKYGEVRPDEQKLLSWCPSNTYPAESYQASKQKQYVSGEGYLVRVGPKH
jgi:hypothetical protein